MAVQVVPVTDVVGVVVDGSLLYYRCRRSNC
jgi:hypothetical protein